MSARSLQIYKRIVRVERVPRGQRPVIQMSLVDGERVVQIKEMPDSDYCFPRARRSRKTVDHTFEVWIEWSTEMEL